jgi:hypothetical protein
MLILNAVSTTAVVIAEMAKNNKNIRYLSNIISYNLPEKKAWIIKKLVPGYEPQSELVDWIYLEQQKQSAAKL